MKKIVLTNFDEIGCCLDEFPEFSIMAERAGIHNFAEAYRIYSHSLGTPYSLEHAYKQNVAIFILWLALADKGDYRIVISKEGIFNQYREISNMIGSHIEIYHQAQQYYQNAQRLFYRLERK